MPHKAEINTAAFSWSCTNTSRELASLWRDKARQDEQFHRHITYPGLRQLPGMASNSPVKAFTCKSSFSLDPSNRGSRRVGHLGRGTGTGCTFVRWHRHGWWQCRTGACSAPVCLDNKRVTKSAPTRFWRLLGPRGTSLVPFILHTGCRPPKCWGLVGFSRLGETLVVWLFQASSAYKKRVKQRNLIGLDLQIASGHLTFILR